MWTDFVSIAILLLVRLSLVLKAIYFAYFLLYKRKNKIPPSGNRQCKYKNSEKKCYITELAQEPFSSTCHSSDISSKVTFFPEHQTARLGARCITYYGSKASVGTNLGGNEQREEGGKEREKKEGYRDCLQKMRFGRHLCINLITFIFSMD